ncbi:hypothetical protein [Geminisphaera colitermitum]|uniref:hypothetical protein n=1 Tax=Geminisphaera colitermitum TaxID=1148786 RepID=UPI000158C93A|nr:hypothetical protein [Geminisphaera colitermitum]
MTAQLDMFAAMPASLPPWEDPEKCKGATICPCTDPDTGRTYYSICCTDADREVLQTYRRETRSAALALMEQIKAKLDQNTQRELAFGD